MALITLNFISTCLMRSVTVNAIIPFDKITYPGMAPREKKPFKTLILLHGIFGNYTDWVSGTRVQRWAEEKNLAVIMPSGENHFYVDCQANGERFSEFIGKELPEKMRELFPLSDRREDTYIAGLSMGGYGAIMNGLKYHDTFSHIAGLSSALLLEDLMAPSSTLLTNTIFGERYVSTVFGDPKKIQGSDKDYKALVTKLEEEKKDIPKIYLCCGTEDELLGKNREFAEFLQRHGADCTYEEGPGGHEWDFWDRSIKKVIDWLPLEGTSKGINSGNVR